ncbi:SpoVR family protein [Aliidongia dinghuensis]|uniref:SpoVR family protein n=1 Tax=Aliidongia dinghuensis TaxID=1867774 RepID=A0A8J3E689_9PROT|nr:SpoVR family protein [Aliidongia dinghuensis]GGF39254.1 SpoVR family protein [Aliidongia dinghuensis]
MRRTIERQAPLFEGADWDYEKLKRAYDAIELIARKDLGLDTYPTQVEVITSEQMLDAYASVGLPLMYRHWSFGKSFAYNEALYRKGLQGLAYEIVINSNPCLCYIMEENSMTMQTLVMAHAAFGHNHFFKNNYLFKQWTDASGILDYLAFARDFVAKCEERYSVSRVERVLDAAHALMDQSVNRYARRGLSFAEESKREKERRQYAEQTFNDLWRTVPTKATLEGFDTKEAAQFRQETNRRFGLPEENLLYFMEKHAPKLEGWERELCRIVRNIAQYYYPQKQTKVTNEGCATFVHYEIMHRLHEKGLLTDGSMLEFLHSHTSVVFQPDYDDRRYGGINPYALGFAMMEDVKRMCLDPTEEDRYWFPEIAGNKDPYGTLRDAWANYRDESFILQFLSPHVMRKFRFFRVRDDAAETNMLVDAIHDEMGYRDLRAALARSYDLSRREPDINVVELDMAGDRTLVLRHAVYEGILLDEKTSQSVLRHLVELWGYPVRLIESDATTDAVLKTHALAPDA